LIQIEKMNWPTCPLNIQVRTRAGRTYFEKEKGELAQVSEAEFWIAVPVENLTAAEGGTRALQESGVWTHAADEAAEARGAACALNSRVGRTDSYLGEF
jgi:hypothetical protein